MEKLNLNFSPSQVLKAATMNVITGKVDEMIEEVNTLPAMRAATEAVNLRVDEVIESDVDISQAEFDELQASGELDETKTYYIYEE